jgi:hypothetical protein
LYHSLDKWIKNVRMKKNVQAATENKISILCLVWGHFNSDMAVGRFLQVRRGGGRGIKEKVVAADKMHIN